MSIKPIIRDGCKANIRWTWYMIEKRSGIILAWQNGRRTDEVLENLLAKVAHSHRP